LNPGSCRFEDMRLINNVSRSATMKWKQLRKNLIDWFPIRLNGEGARVVQGH